jgi:hypothetical protein
MRTIAEPHGRLLILSRIALLLPDSTATSYSTRLASFPAYEPAHVGGDAGGVAGGGGG